VAVAGWADRGTALAVQARDSAWAVAEDQVAGERVAEQVLVEAAAQAVRVAAGAAVPVCGIRVDQGAVAAPALGQARVAQVVEVDLAVELGPALAQAAVDLGEVAQAARVELEVLAEV
jgi:hypothetical protein